MFIDIIDTKFKMPYRVLRSYLLNFMYCYRDGFISNEELFTVLKMMTGDNLTDVQLQQIVNRTILYLDKNNDGKIGLEEFTQGKKNICYSIVIYFILKYYNML
jgi:hypothetical protein